MAIQKNRSIKNVFLKLVRFPVQAALYLLEGMVSLIEGLQQAIFLRVLRPEYVRKGSCQQSGQCCRAIGIELPLLWFNYPRLIRLIQAWHVFRYNFNAEEMQPPLLVYSCNYLTASNQCGIQRVKPRLCRNFPQQPLWGIIRLHKGCGFYYEKSRGKDFGAVMRGRSTRPFLPDFRDDSRNGPLQKENPKGDSDT